MTQRLQKALLLITMLAATPSVALGQATLTELGAANAARNDMMSNSAGAATAAAPEARPGATAAASPPVSYGMKYTLSYALTGLLLGLGMYLVCRPSHRHEAD